MLFSSTDQLIALAIVLLAGWLLGLASHPGGRRWRERYTAERDAHAVDRKALEAKLAVANTRITELERETARLGKGAPIAVAAPATAQPVAGARPMAVATAPVQASRGWFDWR